MRTLLLSNGFKESQEKGADFIIINTCAVVEKTQRKILKQANEFKKTGKKIILTGCLPAVVQTECEASADAVLGAQNVGLVIKAIKEIQKGNKLVVLKGKEINKAKLLKQTRPDPKNVVAITAIAEGCLGDCSYCATKLARKKLNSFGTKDILKEIKLKIESGFKEIQLTSQDLAVFGFDKKQRKLLLPELLGGIAALPGDFKIKLGMMNPTHAKIIFKDLLEIMESDKFYKFLHIPAQSGSDAVLKKMKRGNRAADFIVLAEKFRKIFPSGVLATDIIVGHPAETEEDFQKTVELIKKARPDVLHVFKFSKRKGTADYALKDYPDRIKKERSRILNNIFKDYNLKRNKEFLKTKQRALIVKKNEDGYLGRTLDGRAVAISKGKIGEYKELKIIGYKWNYLIGEE